MFDSRLPVHTIVREDIFAGVMAHDMDRLARADRNIEVLLVERPDAKAPLLAWKGSIALTRAVYVRAMFEAGHDAANRAEEPGVRKSLPSLSQFQRGRRTASTTKR